MAASLPEFSPFDVTDTSTLGSRWKKWLSRLENLFLAMSIADSDAEKKRKKALLLHYAGEGVYDVYETIKANTDSFTEVREKLNQYFIPQINKEYEVYVFRHSNKNSDESLDEYVTRLRKIVVNCGFVNPESEVKSQLIQGCLSLQLRKKPYLKI